jgi:hypothetical protein
VRPSLTVGRILSFSPVDGRVLLQQWTTSGNCCGVCSMEDQMASMNKMLDDPAMKEMMISMMRGMDGETLAKMTGMPPEKVLPLLPISSVNANVWSV